MRMQTQKTNVKCFSNVISLAGRDGSLHCYSFLQYQFTSGERKIKVKQHGNTNKGSRPFKPSATSMMERLKGLVQSSTPMVAVNRLLEEEGGIENIRFSGYIVTFNVGEYYVCLTYQDLMLKMKSGVHPVMLAPLDLNRHKKGEKF